MENERIQNVLSCVKFCAQNLITPNVLSVTIQNDTRFQVL